MCSECHFSSFWTNIEWFFTQKSGIRPQTNIIFGTSTKNCVYLYMFQTVSATFIFQSIFTPISPSGIQSLSLIKTGKFSIILFRLAFDYFTFKWKYFFIYMISGFTSFEWYNLIFFPTCYHGEISGIRSSSPPVVTKDKNPNNNFKQNCWP
jgi:hypothetical protein